MKSLTSIDQLGQIPGPLYLAIGVFDGVHRGHQAVIGQAVNDAFKNRGTAAVMTFDPHPQRVLQPETPAPKLLTSTRHKIRLLRQHGIGWLVMVPFNREFANTPAEEFVERLVSHANDLSGIYVGSTWRFGKKAAGDIELLKSMGQKHGFSVNGLERLEDEGEPISSTRIRAAIEQGDFATAKRLLGRDFTILGTVTPGEQVGRKIGFATANLQVYNEAFPPNGVYAIRAKLIEPGSGEGRSPRKLTGVANLGVRPTIQAASDESKRLLEVHLFNFSNDIYGEDLEVEFVEFLRPEQKFDGLEELKAQISKDSDRAREILS